jgi:hypothetical protein
MHQRLERPRITPPAALQLQQSAGNAAVARMLAREAAPEPANDHGVRMNAAEAKLGAAAKRAQVRSDRINVASDGCVQSVKQSKDHLKAQSTNYKVAFTQFKAILGQADAKYESNKAIEDSVQGILVAAAIGVIGPEMLALTGARAAAAAMAFSTNSTIERVGVSAASAVAGGLNAAAKSPHTAAAAGAALGEGIEQVGGAGVNAGKDATNTGVGAKPSETAKGAASDKFEEAFGQLDGMIDALPEFGDAARTQVALAMAAQELGKEALRTASGNHAKFTPAQIEEKSAAIEAADAAATADQDAVALQVGMQAMALKILTKAVMDPREIERKLWQAWMAGLQDPRVLDNDVIEDYLGPKGLGMVDFGAVTMPWDTRDAVTKAQKDFSQDTTGALPAAPASGSAPPAGPPPR